ncbi:YkvA family protein [Pontibacter ruber]|uniref:YkvA family protein n=1 Tax=Pontibacter ruber TaxID=1343895 RepID=A0ABW5CR36_9BACT|nr:YkvA family protein [Pontibacter ruber]
MLNDLINKGLQLSKSALFQRFLGKAGGVLGKPAKIGMLLSTAYGKLIDANSTKSGFEQVKEVMYTFMRMVKAYSNGSYRDVSKKSMLIGVAVLLYLVSPLDLIPDFIPVLGLMDDISLIAWFIDAFQKEITKFAAWETGTRFEPTPGTL